MLKHFAADGTVKQEFPGAVSVQYIGAKARLWSAKAVVGEVNLQPGDWIGDLQLPVGITGSPTPFSK